MLRADRHTYTPQPSRAEYGRVLTLCGHAGLARGERVVRSASDLVRGRGHSRTPRCPHTHTLKHTHKDTHRSDTACAHHSFHFVCRETVSFFLNSQRLRRHQLLGVSLAKELASEFSSSRSSEMGLSWEFHRASHHSFEQAGSLLVRKKPRYGHSAQHIHIHAHARTHDIGHTKTYCFYCVHAVMHSLHWHSHSCFTCQSLASPRG